MAVRNSIKNVAYKDVRNASVGCIFITVDDKFFLLCLCLLQKKKCCESFKLFYKIIQSERKYFFRNLLRKTM